MRSLKDDLTKNVNFLTTKATVAAESASAMAKAVGQCSHLHNFFFLYQNPCQYDSCMILFFPADKLEIALKLNTRINSLYSLVTDYAEQLSGFDAGLTTQVHTHSHKTNEAILNL